MVSPKTSRPNKSNQPDLPPDMSHVVLQISRISRTVKGGRRIRFRALVIVGNKNGKVGMGVAKAGEVAIAVNKATSYAKKHLIEVPIEKGTIPHDITGVFGCAKIIFRPAPEGTSVIAGSSVRTIVDLAGIRNVVSKIIGSSNKINNAQATLDAFSKLRSRSKE